MEERKPISIEEYSEFIKAHHVSLRAYIYALGAQHDWVDDIAQEVFLVAYRRLTAFDAQGDFGSWLRGIARNLVAYETRREARRQRLMNHAISQKLLAHEPTGILKHSHEVELPDILEECISKLPENGKELLMKRYRDKKSAVKLAEEMKISADALRHRLMRIRSAVKRCIQGRLMEVTP